MINLRFKNYKAFLEGELKIAPITILLGANSSGKSSLLQLLLLLQQSYGITEKYDSPLKLNGKSIKLGEDENIIWNRSRTKNLESEIDYYQGSILNGRLRNLQRRLLEELSSVFTKLRDISRLINSENILQDLDDSKIIRNHSAAPAPTR